MILLIIFGAMLGAAFGSFACCQAWRIRYKAEGKKELGRRSVCLNCKKKLRWYENIPIFSWLIQGGKCRGCKKFIGWAEIISEVLGGIFGGVLGYKYLGGILGASGFEFWIAILEFLLIVVIFTTMGVIAVYDAKWGEMPAKLLWTAVILSMVYAGLEVWQGGDFYNSLVNLGGSVLLLAGTYYILYKVSREKWVGGGDPILCLAIGLILGKPFLALVELSLANILGLMVVLPQKKRKKMIPMGPFLVVAAMIIISLSDFLINII